MTASAAHAPLRIGIVGVGKIARDQHLPALRGSTDFDLIAAADHSSSVDGLPSYSSLEAMLDAHPEIEAVTLATPPAGRRDLVAAALAHGKHVMIEKPPAATLSEVEDMRRLADAAGKVLFATWHSRFAPMVEPARDWLSGRKLKSVRIDWREDVRRWHPGQEWIFSAGGLGVFDPGINALSIATRILPKPFFLTEGMLRFPENRDAPQAADLVFQDADGTPITAGLDFLQTGAQTWDIRIETDGGALLLSDGGSVLTIDGEAPREAPDREYPNLYARFAMLVREGQSDVDASPLRHVADAFLRSRRETAPPFEF